MTRIAIVLPDLRAGGAEIVNLTLAREFASRGHQVDFALAQARGELLRDVPAGCTVTDLGIPRLRNLWPALHRYLRRERPEALLAAMWPVTGIACMAARSAGISVRVVVSEHTDFAMTANIKWMERRALRTFGPAIYRRAAAVIAVSCGVAASLEHCAGIARSHIPVIPNPLRLYLAQDAAHDDRPHLEWWNAAERRLLAMGYLKPAKDFATLLRALKCLRSTTDAKLLLLGEGPLRHSLETLIAELDLGGAVRLIGYRPNPLPFLSKADLFVSSSAWEGFGNVILEALSCGVPVVSTDCPSGPAEILAHGRYGRLVPVRDPAALASAILSELGASHDRDALRQRARDFSAARIADAYLRLLAPQDTVDRTARPMLLTGTA